MRILILAQALILQLTVLLHSAPAGAEPLPESWKKTMKADPAVNFFLRKYGEKSEKPAVQYYRNMYLIALLSGCGTLNINLKAFYDYEGTIGFNRFGADEIKEGKFEAGRLGNDMDVRAAAHLCTGGNYLYGASGTLIPGIMRPNGRPLKINYDPLNPYIRLDLDRIEKSFADSRKKL